MSHNGQFRQFPSMQH